MKRRAPWWVLALALVPLLVIGMLGWSWFQPVTLTVGLNQLRLMWVEDWDYGPSWLPGRFRIIALPGGAGSYMISWGHSPYDD